MTDFGIQFPPGTASGSIPGTVFVGGDPTGIADSTAAIASAIDTVLNNPTLYGALYFKPNGIYKMNNQILRTGIPSTTTIHLQGNGATIDATASTDAAVFDLEGSQGAGDPLNAAVNKSDTSITLTTNAQGIVAGDYILISTSAYAQARFSTGASGSSGQPVITGVTGNLANWNNGDAIFASNLANYPIPFGTTVSMGGGTSSLTLSNNLTATLTSAIVYHPDSTYLAAINRHDSYRSEICVVDSVSGGGPFTLTLRAHTLDSYDPTKAIVYRLQMPSVNYHNMLIKRNTTVSKGVVYNYSRNSEFDHIIMTGAGDYGLLSSYGYLNHYHDNRISAEPAGTGANGYAIAITADMYCRSDHNNLEGYRRPMVLGGGNMPVRFCEVDHEYITQLDSASNSFAAIMIHEPVDSFDIHNCVLINGGIAAALTCPVGGSIRENDITLNLTGSNSPLNIFYFPTYTGAPIDHLIIQNNNILNTTNSSKSAINLEAEYRNAVINEVTLSGNVVRGEGSGNAQLFIAPDNGANDGISGSAINVLRITDSSFIDASNAFIVRVTNSNAGARVQGTKIGECYVQGCNFENTNTGGAANLFFYDPFTGSGPIYFDNTRFKGVRNPGGFSPIQIGTTVDGHHNVTDVTINNCYQIGSASASGSFNQFFNSGIVRMSGGEMTNFTNRRGFYPDNGGAICSGGLCTPGTKSPAAYFLRDVGLTNVSGTFTPASNAQTFTELRGPRQTAIAAGNWAASAGWGTGPTTTPTVGSFDSAGGISITAGTTPAANPTLTLTFTQPYSQAPIMGVAYVSGVGGTFPTTQPVITWVTTTTTLVITYNDTPVAANVYLFNYTVVG